jgi:hypothetical protein
MRRVHGHENLVFDEVGIYTAPLYLVLPGIRLDGKFLDYRS